MIRSAEPRRRGRPSVMPGEPSVPCTVVIEDSLHRRLLRLAAEKHLQIPDLIRLALRQFTHKNLPPHCG